MCFLYVCEGSYFACFLHRLAYLALFMQSILNKKRRERGGNGERETGKDKIDKMSERGEVEPEKRNGEERSGLSA